MFIDEHIERYQKAIRKHYRATHGDAYGWTTLQNILQTTEYSLKPGQNKDSEHFKALQKFAADNNIKVPEPKAAK